MQKSLKFSDDKYISLKEEVDFINDYLNLHKLRTNKQFSFEVYVQSDKPSECIYLPSLLVQPIVENSVKHAFQGLTNGGFIWVEYNVSAMHKTLTVTIKDNGKGEGKSSFLQTGNNKSYGLKIVKDRLAIMWGVQSSVEQQFLFESNNSSNTGHKGTTVRLKIPLKVEEDESHYS